MIWMYLAIAVLFSALLYGAGQALMKDELPREKALGYSIFLGAIWPFTFFLFLVVIFGDKVKKRIEAKEARSKK